MRLGSGALASFLLLSESSAEKLVRRRQRQLFKTEVNGDCHEGRKCSLCEGDCDDDSHCEDGLKCMEREGTRANGKAWNVPGCKLGDDDRPEVDYCYDPTFLDGQQNDAKEEEAEAQNNDNTDEDDVPKVSEKVACGGDDERVQECGASSRFPAQCCPGYVCRGQSIRCEADPNVKPAPTSPPTVAPTMKPSEAPATKRPTQSPTSASERKPRTWKTILTEDTLSKRLQPIIRLEPRYMRQDIGIVSKERDPFKFTEMPSAAPSSIPSSKPSLRPSSSPTSAPTSSPSYPPTAAPTNMRKDECKVKMYYEKKFCWHDDARNSDCDYNYSYCAEADGDEFALRMEECDESPTTWVVLGFTVRPKNNKKLCWTLRGDNGIRLYPCAEEGKGKWENQRFEGVCKGSPHKIRPLVDSKFCLTSGHEPRNGEKLKFQECDKTNNSNTHLWIEK